MTAPAQDKAELLSREDGVASLNTLPLSRFGSDEHRLMQVERRDIRRLLHTALAAYDETGVLYRDRLAEAEKRAEDAEQKLAMIGRMKLFPDDRINRTTLQAAIHLAQGRAALASQPEEPT